MCSLLPALLIQLIVGLVFRSFGQKTVIERICYTPTPRICYTTLNLTESLTENLSGNLIENSTNYCGEDFQRSFSDISGLLRDTAMAVLVMRAGLGFDLNALKRVASTCLMLTVLPCATEIMVCAFLAPVLLGWAVSGFTGVAFGCMMGCVQGGFLECQTFALKLPSERQYLVIFGKKSKFS